ncbi:MAG: SDR family oxidoreductase [Sphingomonadaceae bacterium]|nr:SDR family oxidoreductase [Sphingomonadaceae bacterium]
MGNLAGKVAIVTGAASGIGRATAARLAADGATVIATDIAAAPDYPEGITFRQQDVADAARWAEVVDFAVSHHGRLDILVNNAGYTVHKSIEDVTLADWDRGIGVLLTGVMLGCQTAIKAMKANPGGSSGAIVNVASTTAYAALPGDVTYTSAKSGVRMLTKSVAVHCAQQGYNIRCNAMVPGATDTGVFTKMDAIDPQLRHLVAKTSPLGRLADPAEIAAAIAFLVADGCGFMTGAELLVDGGALAVHPGF